jgi:septal ring factor EnvC (AmiA/AmiB activator)
MLSLSFTLKLLALISAGFFGAFGILHDAKDKSGELTVWGRRALFGAILAGTLSIAILLLETVGALESAADTARLAAETRDQLNAILGSAKSTLASLDEARRDAARSADALGKQQASAEKQLALSLAAQEASQRHLDGIAKQSETMAKRVEASLDRVEYFEVEVQYHLGKLCTSLSNAVENTS